MKKLATKDSWKTLPPRGEFEIVDYSDSFTQNELEALKHGLIPRDMEDKWFIYYDSDILHFHRSWTGDLIFTVRLYQVAFIDVTLKLVFQFTDSIYNQHLPRLKTNLKVTL